MTTPMQARPNTRSQANTRPVSGGARLTRAQTRDLAMELRRETERLERSLSFGESSSELDEHRRALSRIDDGTYGTCVLCDGEIGFGRLQVMPATQWCIRCAR